MQCQRPFLLWLSINNTALMSAELSENGYIIYMHVCKKGHLVC